MRSSLRLFIGILTALLVVSSIFGSAVAMTGSGTSSDPYVVTSDSDLKALGTYIGTYANTYIELGADIVCSGNQTPIGNSTTPFIGHFDGKNHTITNLTISGSPSSPPGYYGLFGRCGSSFSIKNIKFVNGNITATKSLCGILIGHVYSASGAMVENVETDGCTVTSTSYACGGICGGIGGSGIIFRDCKVNKCFISNSSTTGGICGSAEGNSTSGNQSFIRCKVFDSIIKSSSIPIGGITGQAGNSGYNVTSDTCEVRNCLIINTSSSGDARLGGISGYVNGNSTYLNCIVDKCTIYSANGRPFVGGIVGKKGTGSSSVTITSPTVTNCSILGASSVSGIITNSSSISQETVSNNNIYGSSSVYPISPSHADTSTGTTNTSGLYITASGLTATYDSDTGVATYNIIGQRGAGVRSTNNKITGGMDWQYYYPVSEESETNFALTKELTESGTFSSRLTLSNDLNSSGVMVSLSSPIIIVTAPIISSVAVSPSEGGTSTTFTGTVTATSSAGAMTYQWYQSNNSGSTWNAISGATSATSTFTLPSAATYKFKVVVTDSAGSADSYEAFQNVTATVYNPPSVTVSTNKSEGPLSTTVSLSATASGQGTLTYQWKQSTDGTTYTDISGATQATYTATISDASATMHYYRVNVTGTGGTTESNAVTYQSVNAPVISAVSANPTVGGLSGTVALSTIASGSGTLTYQWYEGSSPLSGKTSASVSVSVSDSASTLHTYHVVVTDQYSQATTSDNVTYQSYPAPSVTVTGDKTDGALQSTVTLTATATGQGTLSYQWYEGSTALPGKTSASVTVDVSDSVSTAHTYHVVVTDTYGQTGTSNDVTYTTHEVPTVSVSANSSEGALTSSVTLTAAASGQGTLSYQWYEGSSAIQGATSSTYTANLTDSTGTTHTYHVVVSDVYGQSVTSDNVTYTTVSFPTISTVSASPNDGALQSSVTLTVVASGASPLTYQWYEGSSILSGKTSDVVTVNVSDSAATLHTYKVIVKDKYGQAVTSSDVTYTTHSFPTVTVTISATEGALASSVTVSSSGSSGVTYQWYENDSPISGATQSSYTANLNDSTGTAHTYKVNVTDIYGQTTTSNQVTYTTYNVPVISAVSANPTEGALTSTVGLSVVASGSNLTYQWYEGSTALPGKTSVSVNVDVTDASATTHTYHAVVTDEYGQSAISDNVTYQTYNAPTVTNVSSSPQIGALENTVTLIVSATGQAPLTYQWYEGLSPISGATTATYQASVNDSSATTHTYHAVVTDKFGQSTTSSNVTYESQDVTAVTITIDEAEGALENTVNLTASTEHAGTYTYQWFESTNGTTYTELEGKVSDTISVTISDASATTHRFYAILTDEYGQHSQSNTVIYQSYNGPVVSAVSVNPTEGAFDSLITLSATASGQGTLTYQWYDGTSAIGTGATYEHHVVDTSATVHSYHVDVTDVYNQTTTSDSVTYSTYPAPVVTASANNSDGALQSSVTLTAAASGQGTLSYQWYEGTSAISGATQSTYTANLNDSTGTVHTYHAVVTGTGGTTTSNDVTYTTHDAPVISAVSADPSEGALVQTVELSVTASGSNISYEWKEGQTTIGTASTIQHSVSDSSATTHTYNVTVTDEYSQTATQSVTYQSVNGPSISAVSASPTEGGLVQNVTLSVTATGSGMLTYEWYEGDSKIGTTPNYRVNISDTESTLHEFHVVITDGFGQTTTSNTVTYQSYNPPAVTATISATQGALTNNLTLTATATGQEIASYQWYENGTAISGATASTYNAVVSDASATTHTYSVTVIDEFGQTATSNTVTYQSYNPPVISNVSASPTQGPLTQDVTLAAVVSGATSYQWYEGTSAITGATDSSYTAHITDNTATTHTYTLQATGIGGTTTSTAVTYQSYGAPVISSVSASPEEGPMNNTITLSANVSGAESYVWQENVSGSWNTIGTTVPLMKTVSDSAPTTHTYRLQATGIGGTATSSTVTYQSYALPTISGTAVSPTVGKVTETITLSANVTGADSLQWQISNDGTTWNNITGAVSNPYTQEFVTTQSNTYFRLSATNVAGTAYGSSVTYQRYPPATVTITAEATVVSAPGTGKLTATGQHIDSYQWQEDINGVWTNIAGATNAVYEPYFSESSIHTYRVAVTGQDGNIVTSNTVTIQAGGTPEVTITSPATGTSVHLGTPFRVTATVEDYTSFRWVIDGGQISSQTSDFDIMVRMNDSGDHTIRLIAYNGFGETSRTIHVIVSSSIRQAATSPVSHVEESMGSGILGYVANASTPGPDGQPDLMASITGLLNPYENIMAAWFYLLLFAVPYLIIWIRQKNTLIPSILGILFATFILVKFPATAIPVAIILLVLSISGGIYGIYVKMQR